MATKKNGKVVIRKLDPDIPECAIDSLVYDAACLEDAEWEVEFGGNTYMLCDNHKGDVKEMAISLGATLDEEDE